MPSVLLASALSATVLRLVTVSLTPEKQQDLQPEVFLWQVYLLIWQPRHTGQPGTARQSSRNVGLRLHYHALRQDANRPGTRRLSLDQRCVERQLRMGRDLRRNPPQSDKPLNYLVYPSVEVEGEEHPNLALACSFSDSPTQGQGSRRDSTRALLSCAKIKGSRDFSRRLLLGPRAFRMLSRHDDLPWSARRLGQVWWRRRRQWRLTVRRLGYVL